MNNWNFPLSFSNAAWKRRVVVGSPTPVSWISFSVTNQKSGEICLLLPSGTPRNESCRTWGPLGKLVGFASHLSYFIAENNKVQEKISTTDNCLVKEPRPKSVFLTTQCSFCFQCHLHFQCSKLILAPFCHPLLVLNITTEMFPQILIFKKVFAWHII